MPLDVSGGAEPDKKWERNTWSAKNVSKIIASSSDMMKINSQNKSFSATVHRELLCYYSPYYTAALKGGFAEAQTNTITVDLSDEETADLVSWLYSGQIISSYYSQLFDVYVFADEKKMLALRRSLMSKIVLCCNASHEDSEANEINYFGLDDMLPYIYRLPPSCGLFRYLADFYVHHWILMPCDVRFDKEDPDKRIPREFYWYVIKALAADRNRMITPKASNLLCRCCQHSSCNYHEHVNGDEWGQTCEEVYESTPTDINVPGESYYN
ncbi:hypothetical protein D6D00_08503 [Aureobasidium pullulans]|nr:hypothetical protein D6D00_08503 [Aureobasidium pullulans]